jgi:hypothetical protein
MYTYTSHILRTELHIALIQNKICETWLHNKKGCGWPALCPTRMHALHKTIRQLGRIRKSPVVDSSEAGLLLYRQFPSRAEE